MDSSTATVCYIRSLASVLEGAGLPVARFCERLGIDGDTLWNIDARVPKAVVSEAWEIAAEVTQNEHLGLLASLHAPPGTYPVLDHIAANLPTVGEALRSVARYCRLCDDELGMSFESVPAGAMVSLTFPGKPLRYSRHWAEWFVGLIVSRARSLGGQPDLRPVQVTFQNPAPVTDTTLRLLLGCTPQFGSPTTSVTFGHAALALKIRDASSFLSRIITQHAERDLERIAPSDRFTDEIRRGLAEILNEEAPRIATLARKAGCSVRSLQARLKSEGTSYEELLDGVRRALALQYVEDRDIRMIEVALLLKFSEPSTFYRAFKRWTGTAPLDYRRQLANRPVARPTAAT